ncbi:MAG: DMT family transporter [Candidatus Babeliales bacterium]
MKLLLLLLSYAFIAISFTLAKAVLAYSAPIFFVAFRMILAGAVLLAYCYWRNPYMLAVRKKEYGKFALIVLMHIYFSYVFDLLALQYMSSFRGAFIYNLSPFITALFSYFYFSEHMTPKKWLGLLIGFVGFVPELLVQAPGDSLCCISWGEFLMICSVFAAVVGWIVMRMLVKDGYSPLAINGIGMMGGGLLALVTSGVFEAWNPVPVSDWAQFLKITIAVIITANLIYYNLYGYLLRTYTATFMSFAGFLCPLYAAIFGWYFLGEQVTLTFFFSLFVVVIGLVIFYQEELKQGYIRF